MSLLSEFLAITQDWRSVFPQERTFQRAVRQALVLWFVWADAA
jgi:hypothetical protein